MLWPRDFPSPPPNSQGNHHKSTPDVEGDDIPQ